MRREGGVKASESSGKLLHLGKIPNNLCEERRSSAAPFQIAQAVERRVRGWRCSALQLAEPEADFELRFSFQENSNSWNLATGEAQTDVILIDLVKRFPALHKKHGKLRRGKTAHGLRAAPPGARRWPTLSR